LPDGLRDLRDHYPARKETPGMAIVKTSVNLPEEAVEALRELSESSGSSMAEVLRRAITTEKYLQDTVAEGGKVLIQDPDRKTVKELLIRPSFRRRVTGSK
jgi:hypothetical protein